MELNYNWKLSDGYPPLTRGKVFSCFACGGGSTMGYKLAGFDVIGCNEIDPRMMGVYIANHHPQYSFLGDIRTFKNRTDLPEELYNLDILDGSPPCSSFSMAGSREDGWGVEKKFKEGQANQVLDTLFFDFIDLAKKLQPKIVIAENVKGLIIGEAREYYKKISFSFEDAGYEIQDFLLNAADMGVPQQRERVFFIGLRKDLCEPFMEHINLFHQKPKIRMAWEMRHITYGEIEEKGAICGIYPLPPSRAAAWDITDIGCSFSESTGVGFTSYKIDPDLPLRTINCGWKPRDGGFHYRIKRALTFSEICKGGAWPMDYNFLNVHCSDIIGMSVPPLMTARIANEIWLQWLSKINPPCPL